MLRAVACAQDSRASRAIEFKLLSQSRLPVSLAELGGVVQRGWDGKVYSFSVEDAVVHRFTSSGSTERIALEPTPESATAEVTLMQDIAVDSTGRILVPATWRAAKPPGAAGIFIFDRMGRYQRTIPLLQTSVRHVALSPNGDIFTLGLDTDFVRGRSGSCFLMGKYTQSGTRTLAFSPCPGRGAEIARLNSEIDRGSLWIEDGRLYQLMPGARVVRVFDAATGRWIGETTLESPGLGVSELWRVFSLANGMYLAQWRDARVLTVHNSSGDVIARGNPPLPSSVPIDSDHAGVTFLAGDSEHNNYLVRAAVSIRR